MKPNWICIESVEHLLDIFNEKNHKIKLFFKHSTRCSISSMALKFFESDWKTADDVECYFIDLIKFREVSNKLAEISGVEHQSPQVIVIANNEVIYHASHNSIDVEKIFNTI
jgi:bacillithiol system protein YtxJ